MARPSILLRYASASSGWYRSTRPSMARSGRRSPRSPRRPAARRNLAGCGRRARRRAAPGLTTDERVRLKALERENVELKRANEILRKAAAFFAQAELDRRPK